jgi:hypothetical protein
MRRGVTGDRGINEGRPGGEARLCRESALTQAGGCHVDSPPPERGTRRKQARHWTASHAQAAEAGTEMLSGMRRIEALIAAYDAEIILALAAKRG